MRRGQERGTFKPLPPADFIDYGVTEHGANAEMRWESLRDDDYVVPNEKFFVRSHGATPVVDAAAWRLHVQGPGLVSPFILTYGELLALKSRSIVRALECAGNGRRVFSQTHGTLPDGAPWGLGAIGVAEWTGVPLRDLLERGGIMSSARDVMAFGLDDAGVARPITVAKAMEEETLIAYAMNGDALPADHGFPARLLVPGWAAVASIKWLGRLVVSTTPQFSHWNTKQYVLVGDEYVANPPADGMAITGQTLKSAIHLPEGARLSRGIHVLRGRAWAPASRITRVEVSLDGSPWQDARIYGPNIAGAWGQWSLEWTATPGAHRIRVRATDDCGNVQPETVPYNELGYLNGAVFSHSVTVD
jgi:DMSO/TMAO reductase YedYZ molybdopterin-dependent catalytic subunit